MDDYQILIYIVFIVLYFLSRVLRRKKPVIGDDPQASDASGPTTSQADNRPRKKPVTFEELLHELEGQPAEAVEVEEEEEQQEPEKEQEPEKPQRVYESAIDKPAIKPEWEKYMKEGGLKTLDESVDLDAPLRKRFGTYQISEKEDIHKASRYRKILKSGDTVKDAIILKEILDRKHF